MWSKAKETAQQQRPGFSENARVFIRSNVVTIHLFLTDYQLFMQSLMRQPDQEIWWSMNQMVCN